MGKGGPNTTNSGRRPGQMILWRVGLANRCFEKNHRLLLGCCSPKARDVEPSHAPDFNVGNFVFAGQKRRTQKADMTREKKQKKEAGRRGQVHKSRASRL